MEESKLKAIALFADLSREQLAQLAGLTDEIVVPAGTRLIDEGSFAHEFLLILAGSAEVRRGQQLLATLGPGEFAGEIGAMRDARRNATVTAVSELRALVMTARDLRHVTAQMPTVAARIDATIAARGG
jgi:CRP/FNR family transcriptional regulator, cyclic AMP receptor protein